MQEGQEYHVSNRTIQYVKEVTGCQLPDRRKKSESEDSEMSSTNRKIPQESLDLEHNSKDVNDKKYSFYIEETMGKYLNNYVQILKHEIACKKNAFSLFDVKNPETDQQKVQQEPANARL